tara:strand:- start:184 stop:432 length:249 start_codon:yes stop_codon:yes gene_type:complete
MEYHKITRLPSMDFFGISYEYIKDNNHDRWEHYSQEGILIDSNCGTKYRKYSVQYDPRIMYGDTLFMEEISEDEFILAVDVQ